VKRFSQKGSEDIKNLKTTVLGEQHATYGQKERDREGEREREIRRQREKERRKERNKERQAVTFRCYVITT
jgi:hypothetical protein